MVFFHPLDQRCSCYSSMAKNPGCQILRDPLAEVRSRWSIRGGHDGHYIRTLTSTDKELWDRQPLPELVYTHTHTQAPMKSKDIIHNFLYLFFRIRRMRIGIRKNLRVKRLGCQLAITPFWDLQTFGGGIRQTNKKDEADVLVYGTRGSNLQ